MGLLLWTFVMLYFFVIFFLFSFSFTQFCVNYSNNYFCVGEEINTNIDLIYNGTNIFNQSFFNKERLNLIENEDLIDRLNTIESYNLNNRINNYDNLNIEQRLNNLEGNEMLIIQNRGSAGQRDTVPSCFAPGDCIFTIDIDNILINENNFYGISGNLININTGTYEIEGFSQFIDEGPDGAQDIQCYMIRSPDTFILYTNQAHSNTAGNTGQLLIYQGIINVQTPGDYLFQCRTVKSANRDLVRTVGTFNFGIQSISDSIKIKRIS